MHHIYLSPKFSTNSTYFLISPNCLEYMLVEVRFGHRTLQLGGWLASSIILIVMTHRVEFEDMFNLHIQ